MTNVVWHRGVPWLREALASAQAADVADVVTEVARGGRIAIEATGAHSSEPSKIERGAHIAVLSPELVVIGYEYPEQEDVPTPTKKGGHGPKSYDQLIEWLADAGYYTTDATAGGHRAVLSPEGVRLVTINTTPSDRRAFLNDISTCRRVLGLELRK